MVIADSIDAIYQSLWTPSTGCTFLIVNVDFLFSTIATLTVVQYVYPQSPLNCGCVTNPNEPSFTRPLWARPALYLPIARAHLDFCRCTMLHWNIAVAALVLHCDGIKLLYCTITSWYCTITWRYGTIIWWYCTDSGWVAHCGWVAEQKAFLNSFREKSVLTTQI